MLEFNLKQLEVFVAAAEQGSFTGAAQALYLTQSTVSAHIHILEQALGQPLFHRESRKRVRLTEAGMQAYPMAREILRQCQALQDAFLPEDSRNALLLGASTVPCRCLLPELMSGFLEKCPGCRYLLKKGDTDQVHRWLDSREIHVGFVGARLDETRFQYRPLIRDELVLLTANTSRYQALRDQGVSGNALLREPMIVREPGSGTRQRFDAYLQSLGQTPDALQIVAQIDQPDVILSSVESGVGVTVASRLSARELLERGRLLAFSLDGGGLYRELYLVTLKEALPTRQEQAFCEFVLHRCVGHASE